MRPENAEQLEQLTAYLDGELAPDDRAEIERLLDGDAEARRLLDELRETATLVAGLPRGRAPADLAEQINARLERQALLDDAPMTATPVRSGWSWANRLALAAAVVLVCTVAWLGWPQLEKPAATPLTFADKDEDIKLFGAEESAVALRGSRDSDDGRSSLPTTAGEKPRTPAGRGRGSSLEAVDKPIADRGAVAKVPPLDHRDETRLGAAMPKDAVAAKADAPAETASIERRLAGNTLKVADLQQAEMSKWSNQMVIQARDPGEVVQFARFIREDMIRNDVPSLAAVAAAEPIAPETSFYNFNAVDPSQRARAIGGEAIEPAFVEPAVETPTVIVRVTRSQAGHLIASMQNFAEDNDVDASWTFNGRPVSQDAVAGKVVPQLVASDVLPSGALEKMRLAVGDAYEADFDDEEADETPENRKKQAGTAQAKDAKKTSDSPPTKGAPAGRAGRMRLRESAASRLDSSAAGDSEFVTLAIALRYDAEGPPPSATAAEAKRRRTATTTRAAPTPAPPLMGPPAPASQPTTRESPSG